MVIVRRSDKPVQYDDKGGIVEACLSKYDFQYSMNLLGGTFRAADHLKLKQGGRGLNAWDGATFLTQDEMDRSYEEIEAYPIYYDVSTFHKRTFPYEKSMPGGKNRHGSPQQEVGIVIDAAKVGWGETQSADKSYAVIEIVHEPTFMNYWHVTLRVYENNSSHNAITQGKGAWRKAVRNAVYDFLKKDYVRGNDVTIDNIDERYYIVQ